MRVNGYTNSTVKLRRYTATDTILREGLNRAHFDGFVASEESCEIVAGKIENLFSVLTSFGLGPPFDQKLQALKRDRSVLLE